MSIRRNVCTVALCLLLTVATRAQSLAQDAFYKGKQVTVLVNFAAGGPTDVEAETLHAIDRATYRRQSAVDRSQS